MTARAIMAGLGKLGAQDHQGVAIPVPYYSFIKMGARYSNRHSRVSGNPETPAGSMPVFSLPFWIPAYAGMTV